MTEPDNEIGDDGAQALTECLKELPGLKDLDLSGKCVLTIAHSRKWHTRTTPASIGCDRCDCGCGYQCTNVC